MDVVHGNRQNVGMRIDTQAHTEAHMDAEA